MLRLISCIRGAPHSALGPSFFPVRLWGLEEGKHLPQMMLSMEVLLKSGSPLPLGDPEGHAGVSFSWDMGFPDASLLSRRLDPACCKIARPSRT